MDVAFDQRRRNMTICVQRPPIRRVEGLVIEVRGYFQIDAVVIRMGGRVAMKKVQDNGGHEGEIGR